MNYLEVIRLLSEFDPGALLISQDDYILEANEAADRLLHGGGTLRGQPLREVAPALCEENSGGFKVAYYEYLVQCPAPKDVELPVNTRLVCFRDASFESSHHAQCRMIAKSVSPVMIYGETGAGKELLAHSIHNASDRANEPFLTVNCAAIPENLLESMLFGTEKGAYTGAERRPGLFEQADGGTLLLDELNSMSMVLQAKLLRILQDGVVRRVGSTEEKKVDVRVLSSMNIPPYQAIEENKLRQDIFYRLGVAYLSIPPLRKRKDDIPILTRSFFVSMNCKLNKSVESVSDDVMAIFCAYNWPGNVRELQHCIEHAMNILPGDATVITREYLPEHILEKSGQSLCINTGEMERNGGL